MAVIRVPASGQMANTNNPLESARRFLAFVNASPTPFHAVHNASLRLEQAGFHKVSSTINILSSVFKQESNQAKRER